MLALTNPPAVHDQSAWSLVRRLLREHGRAHAWAYVAAVILMAVSGAATALSVALLKPVVNGMADVDGMTGAFKQLRFLAFAVAALYILRGIATFGQLVIMSRTGNRIIATMQARLYNHLLGQPVAFFSDRHSSELMARLALAANGVRDIVQLIVTSAGRDVVTALGLLVVMIYNDSLMAVMVLTVMPVGALLLGRMIRRIRKFARRSFDGSTKIMQIMQETVLGIRIVKSFNLEGLMSRRMDASIREVEKAANRMSVGVAMSSPRLGDAGRSGRSADHPLRQLARLRRACRPRVVLCLHRCADLGLRTGQAPRQTEPRSPERARQCPDDLRSSRRTSSGDREPRRPETADRIGAHQP